MTTIIHTEHAPAAIGPYVQAIDLGNLVLTSGQIPVNPTTGDIPTDIVAQARQSLENIKAIIEQAGLTVEDIVKTTVFVKDLNDFTAVNAEYERFSSLSRTLLRRSSAITKRCRVRNRSHCNTKIITSATNYQKCGHKLACF